MPITPSKGGTTWGRLKGIACSWAIRPPRGMARRQNRFYLQMEAMALERKPGRIHSRNTNPTVQALKDPRLGA